MYLIVDKWIGIDKSVFKVSVLQFVGSVEQTIDVISNLSFAERPHVKIAGQKVADSVAVSHYPSAYDARADRVVIPIEQRVVVENKHAKSVFRILADVGVVFVEALDFFFDFPNRFLNLPGKDFGSSHVTRHDGHV